MDAEAIILVQVSDYHYVDKSISTVLSMSLWIIKLNV
jgi:hypothetical protein